MTALADLTMVMSNVLGQAPTNGQKQAIAEAYIALADDKQILALTGAVRAALTNEQSAVVTLAMIRQQWRETHQQYNRREAQLAAQAARQAANAGHVDPGL